MTNEESPPSEAGPMTHELKCWPRYFEAIESGLKTFEVRFDDQGFMAGDSLILREWEPRTKSYTGRSLQRKVSYVASLGGIGITGYVGMSLVAPSPKDGQSPESS